MDDIQLQYTGEAPQYIRALVYGRAGVGKTTLLSTAPKIVILSREAGLLSLQSKKTAFIEISGIKDLKKAYKFVKGKKGKNFESIGIDSLTDISEAVLSDLKKKHTDPRKAYAEMFDTMSKWIRRFRDIKGKHIIFTAQIDQKDGEDGLQKGNPSTPGRQLTTRLPYMFDEVFYMYIESDDEDEDPYRAIQTQPNFEYEAKDRSGKLNEIERPDLTYLFNKILSKKKSRKKGKVKPPKNQDE